MTTVITFRNWVESNRIPMPRERQFECHVCKGAKKQISDKSGKEINCKTCQGHGLISGKKTAFDPRTERYIDTVAADLKRLCAWSSRDFFEEMCSFLRSCPRPVPAWVAAPVTDMNKEQG